MFVIVLNESRHYTITGDGRNHTVELKENPIKVLFVAPAQYHDRVIKTFKIDLPYFKQFHSIIIYSFLSIEVDFFGCWEFWQS